MPSASRLLAWLSWATLAAGGVLTAATLVAAWAVNARSYGAQDAGLALTLSYFTAFGLYASMFSAPVLTLAGLATLFLHRDAGLRLLAAGVVASLPVAFLLLMD